MWRSVASNCARSPAKRFLEASCCGLSQRFCSSTGDRPVRPVEQAYTEWSESCGACDVHEFLRGAGQAYLAVGATIEAALRLPKGKFDGDRLVRPRKHEEPLGVSTAGSTDEDSMLQPHTVAAVADENSSSADQVHDELETLVGDSLRKHLVSAIQLTTKGRFNAFVVAHPNDYIVSARLHAFQRFNTSAETTADTIASTTTTSATDHVPPSRAPEDRAPQREALMERKSSPAAAANDDDAKVRPVGISGTIPPTTIPASATAYAIVSLHVVLPFRRFYRLADWFAERIEGHESENERYATATFFAANFTGGVALLLDRVMQLLTGNPVIFQMTKPLKSVLQLPDDGHKCPPCKRKYLGLYHTAEGTWVLAEITNSVEVYGQVVEGTDTS